MAHCDKDMDNFRKCIDECNVVELGYKGSCFTWCWGKSHLLLFVKSWTDFWLILNGSLYSLIRRSDIFPSIDPTMLLSYSTKNAIRRTSSTIICFVLNRFGFQTRAALRL